ncbi:hypothetical protein D3C84_1110840 [compost metagenome]
MADARQHCVQANLFGIVHRATQPVRETVTVDPDQVDIAATLGDTFIEQLDTFIDQHEQAAVMDLLHGERAALDIQFTCNAFGQ